MGWSGPDKQRHARWRRDHRVTGWLDQRLASELYVTARSEEEAARLRDYLRPRADAILPIWRTEGRIAGSPAEIYGVADHATYRQNWPMLEALPDVWSTVAQGEGVLINEQLSYRADLMPGDDVALPGGCGTFEELLEAITWKRLVTSLSEPGCTPSRHDNMSRKENWTCAAALGLTK